jgi:hypothetical protein
MSTSGDQKGYPAKARAALLGVIETQIASNNPPETKEALDRLMAQGFSREQSLKYIASALIGELFGAIKGQASYDQARYIANLKALPKLPWDKE